MIDMYLIVPLKKSKKEKDMHTKKKKKKKNFRKNTCQLGCVMGIVGEVF